MSPDGLASPIPLSAASHVPDGWITYGDGADIDSAYDDAVSSAWFDLGRTRSRASVIDVALGDIVVDEQQPIPMDAALGDAQRRLAGLPPGSAVAVRVGKPNGFRRRRVNVRLTDVGHSLPDEVGNVPYVDQALATVLLELAGALPTERLGNVELRRPVRAGYKPVVVRNQGKNLTRYGVFISGSWGEPLSVHDTASLARRWAVDTLKQGPVAGSPTMTLEVRPVVTRNGQSGVLTVERRRIRQVAALRVELWEPKDVVRHTGWMIAGRAGLTETSDQGPSKS